MIKVIASEDCGNSPKNLFVQEFVIALVRGENQAILNWVTEDIYWEQVGNLSHRGKTAFASALEMMKPERVEELTIHHVATHGRTGAVNGMLRMESGEIHRFCHIFEFGGAKGTSIKEITTYNIRT